MIIKYSEASIEQVITPSTNETEKLQKKIKEATNEDEIVKEAANEEKPFWIKK